MERTTVFTLRHLACSAYGLRNVKAPGALPLKASVRAKVEHPFRRVKRQFGYTKVRYGGLAKNTPQVLTLFALSSLWMARRRLLHPTGQIRLADGEIGQKP